MRAWARSNGFVVADRGRLPAEVTDAYVAAHPGGRKSTAKTAAKPKPAARTASKPVVKRAPAKKAGSRKAAVVATPAAAPAPDVAPVAETPGAPAQTTTSSATQASPAPRPKPSVVEDDRRLVALGEQISALADRVAALEAALKSGGRSNGKASRFRRSR